MILFSFGFLLQRQFLEFERVENKLSQRRDLNAFLLLDKLVPLNEGRHDDIVDGATHDEIWLDISPDKLAEVATEEDILILIRCGVRYSDDCFYMFV